MFKARTTGDDVPGTLSPEKVPIFAGNMKQTIDTYKLTSMEEPSDEILSQIMREAAEDARKSNEEATERYFNQMLMEVRKIAAL